MKKLAVLLVVCVSLSVVGCGTDDASKTNTQKGAENVADVAEMVPMNPDEYLDALHAIMSGLAGDKDIYVEQYGYAVTDGNKTGKENAALQLNTKVVNAYGDIVDLGTAPEQYAKDVDAINKTLTDASQHFAKAFDSLTPETDAESAWRDGLARLDAALKIAYKLTEK